ncbi:hypothetical protein HpHA31_14530 [Helicobacter pylori]
MITKLQKYLISRFHKNQQHNDLNKIQDNSIKNMVGGLNVRYFLPNIQRECVSQKREEVF